MNNRTTEPGDLTCHKLRTRAVAAARGDEPFDILITGGKLVDMVTGEIRKADIGLIGPMIASVHEPATRSDARKIISARGGYVSPGLIDTHMHIESSMVTPAIYAETVVARGVTTIVWDPHEFGNVRGLAVSAGRLKQHVTCHCAYLFWHRPAFLLRPALKCPVLILTVMPWPKCCPGPKSPGLPKS